MIIPSLSVCFVGAWGLDSVFNESFLEEIISVYPLVLIDQGTGSSGLNDYYRQLTPLSSILNGHEIRQIFLADCDRYGYLKDLVDPQLEGSGLISWHYLGIPPAQTMHDIPSTSLDEFKALTDQLLKFNQNTVIYCAFASIWSMAQYREVFAVKQAISATNKYLLAWVHKALQAGFRVLIVSDGEMSNNPLPCVLVSPRLEGLKSDHSDIVGTGMQPQEIKGKVNDLMPTILELMNIPKQKQIKGRVLFKNFVKRTL